MPLPSSARTVFWLEVRDCPNPPPVQLADVHSTFLSWLVIELARGTIIRPIWLWSGRHAWRESSTRQPH